MGPVQGASRVLSPALATLAQASEVEPEPDTTVIAAVLAVGTIVAILVSMWALASRARRARELPAIAAAEGLRYSDVDPFDSTRVAFDLFRAGDGRRVEHVLWDDQSGARAFDYAYFVEQRDRNGTVRQVWTTFSCALARHDGSWPEIRLLRERLFDRALTRVGLPDIDLESEEFNRTFIVQCTDRRFATALLDARMIEALLSAPAKVNVETRGRWVLVWCRRVGSAELPGLLRTAEAFCRNVPPVVRDLYGELPADDPLDGMATAGEGDLGLPYLARERWRDPAWDVGLGSRGGAATPSATPWVGTWDAERLAAQRETLAAMEGRGPAPEVDLDGKPIPPVVEDPWGEGRPGR